MKTIIILLSIVTLFSSFNKAGDSSRLVFEEQKSMRSSFSMYSDGRFYEARPAGCIEQIFSWGYWQVLKDTITLLYQEEPIYYYDLLESKDSTSKYQIIRVLDCYNQPVRFQLICFDTGCLNLHNPAMLKISKGKSVYYPLTITDSNAHGLVGSNPNSDTVTFQWHCNRETIESINGGRLILYNLPMEKRIVLENKEVIEVAPWVRQKNISPPSHNNQNPPR